MSTSFYLVKNFSINKKQPFNVRVSV